MTFPLPAEAVWARYSKIQLVISAFLPLRLAELSAEIGVELEPPRDLLFVDLRSASNAGGNVWRAMPALAIYPSSSTVEQDGAASQTLTQSLFCHVLLPTDHPVAWSTAITEAYLGAVIETLVKFLPDSGDGPCTGVFSARQTSSAQGAPIRLGDLDHMVSAVASLEILQRQSYERAGSSWDVSLMPRYYAETVALERVTLEWDGDLTVEIDTRRGDSPTIAPPAGPFVVRFGYPFNGTLKISVYPSGPAVEVPIADGVAAVPAPGGGAAMSVIFTALTEHGAANSFIINLIEEEVSS